MKLTNYKTAIIIDALSPPASAFHACDAKEVYMLNEGSSVYDDKKYRVPADIKYIPKSGDTIYFHPNCSILRDKVRTWGAKNGVKITTKLNDATVQFVGRTTNQAFRNAKYIERLHKVDMIKFFQENYGSNLSVVEEMIRNTQSDYVFLSRSLLNVSWINEKYSQPITRRDSLGQTTRTKPKLLNQSDLDRADIKVPLSKIAATTRCNGARYSTKEQFSRLADIYYSNNVKDVGSLVALINKDLITLDDAMYQQLNSMLVSKDQADMTVAIECLANCNLETSMGRVMLLLREHWHHISRFKAAKHANFKALLAFLDLDHPSNIGFDDIVNTMLQYGYLTKESLGSIMPMIKEEMEKKANTSHFTIKTITCSEDIIGAIAPHLIKKVTDDK